MEADNKGIAHPTDCQMTNDLGSQNIPAGPGKETRLELQQSLTQRDGVKKSSIIMQNGAGCSNLLVRGFQGPGAWGSACKRTHSEQKAGNL